MLQRQHLDENHLHFYLVLFQYSVKIVIEQQKLLPPNGKRRILSNLQFVHMYHGLMNYIDTKAKCRHKKLTCKGTLRQVFIRVYRLENGSVSHVGIFDPALKTVAPLTFSLVQLFPLPCVNKYSILYTRIQCVRGGGGSGILGLKQINNCRKVPLQVNFFRWRHFALSFYESYLSKHWNVQY